MSNRVFIIVYFVALALAAIVWHLLPPRAVLPPCWGMPTKAVDLTGDCSTIQLKGSAK